MSESRSAPAISSQFSVMNCLATIARHIEIDPEKLSVKMDRSDAVLDAGDRRGNSMRKDQLGVFSLRPTTDASAA
jgi:hypothetical protein